MISQKDFAAAKKAIKGIADSSRAHRIAAETLASRSPEANAELIHRMAWQVVMAAR